MSRDDPNDPDPSPGISRRALLRRGLALGLALNGLAWTGRTAQPRAALAALPMRPPQIVLAAGHHNTAGGNPIEIELVGPITRELARVCRDHGLNVRVVTPDEGLGVFPGRLADIGRQVIEWDQAGWTVDLFLEVHAEGNQSGTAGRGCFVVYPDTDDDVDAVVRDHLGPALIQRLSRATGIPTRGDGLMSERETAVGARGRRLGIFRSTVPLRDHCVRLLVEVGAFTAPQDLAIMQRPGFTALAAEAMGTSLAEFCQPKPLGEFHSEW